MATPAEIDVLPTLDPATTGQDVPVAPVAAGAPINFFPGTVAPLGGSQASFQMPVAPIQIPQALGAPTVQPITISTSQPHAPQPIPVQIPMIPIAAPAAPQPIQIPQIPQYQPAAAPQPIQIPNMYQAQIPTFAQAPPGAIPLAGRPAFPPIPIGVPNQPTQPQPFVPIRIGVSNQPQPFVPIPIGNQPGQFAPQTPSFHPVQVPQPVPIQIPQQRITPIQQPTPPFMQPGQPLPQGYAPQGYAPVMAQQMYAPQAPVAKPKPRGGGSRAKPQSGSFESQVDKHYKVPELKALFKAVMPPKTATPSTKEAVIAALMQNQQALREMYTMIRNKGEPFAQWPANQNVRQMYQQLFPHDAAAAGEAPPPQAAPVAASVPVGMPQPTVLPLQPVAPAWGQGQAAYPIPTQAPTSSALPPALRDTFLKAIQNLLLDPNGSVEQPRSVALTKLLDFIAPLTDSVLNEVVSFAETKYNELPPEAAAAAPAPFIPGEAPQPVMIPQIQTAYPAPQPVMIPQVQTAYPAPQPVMIPQVQTAYPAPQPVMIPQVQMAYPAPQATRMEPPRAVMTTEQYRQAGAAVGDTETEDEPPEEAGEEEDEGSDYSIDDEDEYDEA